MVEEHRLVRMGPVELEAGEDPVLLGNAVLQRALVERHRWEVRQSWMHAVLDLQANWPEPQANQSFE